MTLKCGLKVTEGHVVPFESLGTVSYSLSIVTMAVSVAILEIFSVKEWPDAKYLINGYRYGDSYYRSRIGNCTQAFEWHQFQ